MPKIRIVLPPPHSEIQRKIYDSLVTPGLIETWVACGSKFGKTISAGVAQTRKLYLKKNKIHRWIAPTYPQALYGKRYIEQMIPPKPISHPKKYSIEVPFLQNILEFKTGEKPENLEGEATESNVLDEFSKMRAQAYHSAKTTTTMTGAPFLIISTPRGKNGLFYQKCMEAKRIMEWEIKNGRPITKMFLTAPTSANPLIKKQMIEENRKSMPDRLFRQYMLAEFVDDGGVFTGFRDLYYTDEISINEPRQFWIAPNAAECDVVIGADWAKSVDWTVFFAGDVNTRKVVGFERFHKRPYPDAIKNLIRFSRKFRNTLAVWHDKTGVGDAIDDQLAFTDLPYEGKIFSNNSKSNMVMKLITSIETEQIGLPNWDILDGEFDAYEISTTDLGTVTYNAAEGFHDDTISALMLMNAAFDEYCDQKLEIRFTDDDDKKRPLSDLEKYYADIDDDD